MNATEIIDCIVHREPSLQFLEQTSCLDNPNVLASVIAAIRSIGRSPQNLVDAVAAVGKPVADVCGTGGSSGHRLNTSTLTAFLAPSLAVRIVKHGGRSASGKLGSLDLLERLGLDLSELYSHAAEDFRVTGLAFLPAGLTYAPFARYSQLRKSLGKPTLFNKMGPLLNPVQPSTRLMGAWTPDVARLLARTVHCLGEQAVIVCASTPQGFLDEASPFSDTLLLRVGDTITELTLPALVSGPSRDLSEIFVDAAQVALDLLNEKSTPATEAAQLLVAYNLTLTTLLTSDCSDSDFHQLVSERFFAMNNDFSQLVAAARERLQKIKNLSAEHPATPTKRPPELTFFSGDKHSAKAQPANAHVEVKSPTCSFSPLLHLASREPGWLFAEVKQRTPLHSFPDFSMEKRLNAYQKAQAISVVTHPSFGGSLELLKQIRSLTRLPILAKDFLRRKEDVRPLAEAGANGILLLQDMLSQDDLRRLCDECFALGVTPFIESSWTISSLPDGAMPMLNARNLFTLNESRAYRDDVARQLQHKGRRILLASSAGTPCEATLLLHEFAGIIVGSALMKKTNPEDISGWIESALSHRSFLKACGATSAADVIMALDEGADWVGVNLIPSSLRFVNEKQLSDILALGEQVTSRLVFLTHAQTPAINIKISSILMTGYEQPYAHPRLNRPIIHPQRDATIRGFTKLHILDSAVPGRGQITPFPKASNSPFTPVLIAGGIAPGNVTLRMQEAQNAGWRVAGVDVASGIALSGERGFDRAKIKAIREELNAIGTFKTL